jgi:hypothetical protein
MMVVVFSLFVSQMTRQRKSEPRTNEKRRASTINLTYDLRRADLKRKAAAMGVKGLNLLVQSNFNFFFILKNQYYFDNCCNR